MEKEKVYLGFSSPEEGKLYEDVCIGYLISEDTPAVINKSECEEIIKEERLEGLLESVKNLSRVERFKAIHTYYLNALTMITLKAASMIKNKKVDLLEQNDIVAQAKLYSDIIVTITATASNVLSLEEINDFVTYLDDVTKKTTGNDLRHI